MLALQHFGLFGKRRVTRQLSQKSGYYPFTTGQAIVSLSQATQIGQRHGYHSFITRQAIAPFGYTGQKHGYRQFIRQQVILPWSHTAQLGQKYGYHSFMKQQVFVPWSQTVQPDQKHGYYHSITPQAGVPLRHTLQPRQKYGYHKCIAQQAIVPLKRTVKLGQKYGYHPFSTQVARLSKSVRHPQQTSIPQQGHWTREFHDVASILEMPSPTSVPISVQARIQAVRKQKKHTFMKLGDNSTMRELQVLLSPELSEGLITGSTVKVSGMLQQCPPGLEQEYELVANKITIVGQVDPTTYRLQNKYHTPAFLRTIPHLRLRTPRHRLLARLRSNVDYFCSEWFRDHGFVRIHPPVITSSDSEGAGEMFTVAPASQEYSTEYFFHTPKFLTPSSQLHLEAYVLAHSAVWSLGPTFRAEKSETPRHLSEFYMLEAEILTTSISEVMDLVEQLLRSITTKLSASGLLQEFHSTDKYMDPKNDPRVKGDALEARWKGLQTPEPYPRITYTDAITMLEMAYLQKPDLFNNQPKWGQSLALEHEKFLATTIGKNQTPVFVTDYPANVKPFYMLPSSGCVERQTSSCFDLLLPEVAELVGGSLRIDDAEQLRAAMAAKGIVGKNLDWYLELIKYDGLPHGGFGMGFDRLLCYLSGESNVREVVGFPRWVGRCDG